MSALKVLVLSALMVLGVLALQAQDITKGSIKGVVRDSSGAVVPGARVSLASPNGARTTTTDSIGVYTFENLTAGSGYSVSVNKPGFVTAQAKNLIVGVNHQTTQDFTLRVGQTTAEIEVVGQGAGTIDLSSTTVGTF